MIRFRIRLSKRKLTPVSNFVCIFLNMGPVSPCVGANKSGCQVVDPGVCCCLIGIGIEI